MGMSVSFYAGDASDFFEYRSKERETEGLWLKAYARHAGEEDLGALPEHEWMDKQEFSAWFASYTEQNTLLECRLWDRVPELELGKAYWFVQWILSRRVAWLGHVEDIGTIDPVFVLDSDDLDDLVTRLRAVGTGVDTLREQFPIHEGLAYARNRLVDISSEQTLCETGFMQRLAICMGHVRKYVLGREHQELIVEIFP